MERLMADEDQQKDSPPKPDRTEDMRQMVREDIEEQRKFTEKLKRKMN